MTRTRRRGVTQRGDRGAVAIKFSIFPCERCGEVDSLNDDGKCPLCASGGTPARPHPKPGAELACGCEWHMSKSPEFRATHTARHLKRRAAA